MQLQDRSETIGPCPNEGSDVDTVGRVMDVLWDACIVLRQHVY